MTVHEVHPVSEAFQGLQEAARSIFPVLGFEPEQTESFLQGVRAGAPGMKVFIIDGPEGRGYVGESVAGLEFVIPANWQQRYRIVEASIRALQNQEKRWHLCMDVDEGVPSHSAYFAGMLPGLGFAMEPRVEMMADGDAVRGLQPALPDGFCEVTLTPERAPQVAQVLHEAYVAVHTEWSAEKRAEDQESWTRFVTSESEAELRDDWVAVEYEGTVVGICMKNSRPDAMIISELAVLPAHVRKGLGRYLLRRAMQDMKRGGPAGREYLLSALCRRECLPAVTLYRSVGFRVTKVFTRAFWRR